MQCVVAVLSTKVFFSSSYSASHDTSAVVLRAPFTGQSKLHRCSPREVERTRAHAASAGVRRWQSRVNSVAGRMSSTRVRPFNAQHVVGRPTAHTLAVWAVGITARWWRMPTPMLLPTGAAGRAAKRKARLSCVALRRPRLPSGS